MDKRRRAKTGNSLLIRIDASFRSVLDAAPDAMLVVDRAGRIVVANAHAAALFGWKRADLLGKPVEILVPHGNQHQHAAHRVEFFGDPHVRPMASGLDLFALRSDGTEFPVEISLSPLTTESGIYVTAAIRDISERQKAEGQIKELNRELERRVRDLATSNAELEAFSYSVSHDLRAPLRQVDGFSRILLEEFAQTLPAEAQQYLNRVREGALNMGRLIDELLAFARISRIELVVQPTGLNSIVNDVVEGLKPETAGRAVEWRLGQLPFVECDPRLMRQVFVNLLANGLKYTRPREKAVIEVGQETIDGAATIFVRDNGVGFSMRHADKLFGVFQRLHRQEDFEGTGIGLATAQRIIHKHGGRIWAEAEIDKGATFYFTIAPS